MSKQKRERSGGASGFFGGSFGNTVGTSNRRYGGLSSNMALGLMRRNSIDGTGYDPEQDRFVGEVRISWHIDNCASGQSCGGVALLTRPSYSEFQASMDYMAGSMESELDAIRNARRRAEARADLASPGLAGLRGALSDISDTDREGLNARVTDGKALKDFAKTNGFYQGNDIGFHAEEMGCNISGVVCTGFRSEKGSMGIKVSMQLVYNETTGRLYIDKDRFNPRQDVAGALGHLFLELGQGARVQTPQIFDRIRSSYNR